MASEQVEKIKALLTSTPTWRLSLEEMSQENKARLVWRRDDFAFGSVFTKEERPSMSFAQDYSLIVQDINGTSEKGTYKLVEQSGKVQLETLIEQQFLRKFDFEILQSDQIVFQTNKTSTFDHLKSVFTSSPIWRLSLEEMSQDMKNLLIWRRDDFAFGSVFTKEERPSMSFARDNQLTVRDISGTMETGTYAIVQKQDKMQLETEMAKETRRVFDIIIVEPDRLMLNKL